MLEIIAKTGLFFNKPGLLIGVFFVGYLLLDKALYGRALILLLFTMIYNVYLKQLFHMPLPAHMDGWAFPSGHMHCAFVFWGYLATQYRPIWIKAILGFMICLGGYGLVYSGYHYPMDILGAIGFGSLSIFIYRFLTKYPGEILSLACIALMFMFTKLKPDVWLALGGIIGFTIGSYQVKKISFTLLPLALLGLLLPLPNYGVNFLMTFAVGLGITSINPLAFDLLFKNNNLKVKKNV